MLHADYCQLRTSLPTIVFIHGDMQNGSSFNLLARWFQKIGHSTLQIDLPGHGNSSFGAESRDILNIIDNELSSRNIVNPILVGHSSGGIIAAQYALSTGNTLSLIALNSCLTNPLRFNPALVGVGDYLLGKSKELFTGQERVDYSVLQSSSDDEIRMLGLKTTASEGLKNNFSFMLSLPINQSFRNLSIPVLLLNDPADSVLPWSDVCTLSSEIGNLRMVELHGGHNVFIHDIGPITQLIEKNSDFFHGTQSTQRMGTQQQQAGN